VTADKQHYPELHLASRIEEAQEAGQDDETRRIILATEVALAPILVRNRWQPIYAGEDGLGAWELLRKGLRLIHSIARETDGCVWAHLSLSRRDRKMPTWEQLRDVWRLLYPDVLAVVVIPPAAQHVNIAEVAHAWANLDRPAVPDFTHGLDSI
jgi:hypothetical protein